MDPATKVESTTMGACFSTINTAVIPLPLYTDTGPNLKLIPVSDQPHILDLPLNQVSVMTSHNSYIRTLQHGGEASTDALRIALNRGCRCLELDIYRDPENPHNVFVAHGKEELPHDIITTTRLSLDDAFKTISIHAFARSNDPLFIALELNVHNDLSACDAIAHLIDRYFSERLLNEPLTSNIPLRNLLDKVIFLTGGGAAGHLLPSLMDTQWSEEFQNLSSATLAGSIDSTGNCVRIYPEGNMQSAFSLNYNPIPFLMNGVTFVAMNVCTQDIHMTYYETWFASSSFVKKPSLT